MTRLDRKFIQDPQTLYRRLRAEAPAAPVTMWGGTPVWLITRYDEAKALLHDSRLGKDLGILPAGVAVKAPFATMLETDPPDHTRLRRLVVKAFTARSVERLRPRVAQIADELLDVIEAAAAGGPVDLMESFAAPLPIRVIGELLGVPPVDRERFRTYVEPLLTAIDPNRRALAGSSLRRLLSAVIASKRRRPADDLLTALVEVTDGGDALSEKELLSTAYLLILAGDETTVNLIGNGILALLQNPAQLARLRDNPAELPSAVEEFLRFASPVNIATIRFTTVPIRVGEVDIPARQLVMIALLGANRDSGQFPDPDQLDITRKPNAHLSFGYGTHYCVGAPLARLEAQVALGRLLAKFDQISLADDAGLESRNSTLMRGLKALPVLLGGAMAPAVLDVATSAVRRQSTVEP
jgi:cytochrome P450